MSPASILRWGRPTPTCRRDGPFRSACAPNSSSATAAPGLPARVRRVADLGRKRLAYVSLAENPLVVTVPNEMESVGDSVNIAIDPANTHVYVDDVRVAGSAP